MNGRRWFNEEDLAPLVALSATAFLGPARLQTLIHAYPPAEVWARLTQGFGSLEAPVRNELAGQGVTARVAAAWVDACRRVDPAEVLAACSAKGISVLTWHSPAYPEAFLAEPEPPPVLFALGSLDAVVTPAVALVGTRRASSYGREVAAELGEDLAAAGVTVVSGLARGIDGAAHAGAVRASDGAPPVAVVGTPLDLVYPAGHAALYREVAAAGVILSEVAPGSVVERWRFPARNRLLAALSTMVVVVESHRSGGALITADLAEVRNRMVGGVPGSVRSPASAGALEVTRRPGAFVIRDADDILEALGLVSLRGEVSRPVGKPADPNQAAALAALGWEPQTFDGLAGRSGLPLGELATAIEALERAGYLRYEGGYLRQRRPSQRKCNTGEKANDVNASKRKLPTMGT